MHKLRDAPGDSEADLKKQLEGIAGEGKVYVLGLGNTDRGDDGAGVLVALALKKLFPSYSYSEHDGVEGTVLDISDRKGKATVFFIDAANLNREPGVVEVVQREDIRENEITTHRVAVALMASILKANGKSSAVVCIQPKTIEFQAKVSSPMKRSIETVTRVLAQVMKTRD